MIREVDLVSYLPPFIAEFQEISATLTAENPEFKIVWEAADRVLQNQFLETADVHGVAVWEKELNIRPKDTETLEERKKTIRAKWGLELPYTMRWLQNWLTNVCNPFQHEELLEDYTLSIHVYNEVPSDTARDLSGLTDRILKMLQPICPANILLSLKSTITNLGDSTYVRLTPVLGPCLSVTELPELEPLPSVQIALTNVSCLTGTEPIQPERVENL